VLLVAGTIALVVAAVWLSLNRRRTLIELGVGVCLALIVARVVTDRVEQNVVNGLKSAAGGGVAVAALRAVVGDLQTFTLSFLIAGLVVAVGAYLLGKPEWFRRMGRSAAGIGASGAAATARPSGAVERFIVRRSDWFRLGGVVAAVVVLLAATPSWGWIIAIVLLLLAWELLVRYIIFHATPPAESL
jgi:hypothetical protein